jgi:hypothetical protein
MNTATVIKAFAGPNRRVAHLRLSSLCVIHVDLTARLEGFGYVGIGQQQVAFNRNSIQPAALHFHSLEGFEKHRAHQVQLPCPL